MHEAHLRTVKDTTALPLFFQNEFNIMELFLISQFPIYTIFWIPLFDNKIVFLWDITITSFFLHNKNCIVNLPVDEEVRKIQTHRSQIEGTMLLQNIALRLPPQPVVPQLQPSSAENR